MLPLRNYQKVFSSEIMEALQSYSSVLAVLSTGGGKTLCFSRIVMQHDGPSAVVVHRKEIIGQISLSLARCGVKHRIVAPPPVVKWVIRKHLSEVGVSFVDHFARCGVASAQTLTGKALSKGPVDKWRRTVTLSVFDEGHHYIQTGLWAKAVNAFPASKKLFFTATPARTDGRGLGVHAEGFSEVMVTGPDTKWLISEGYLSPYRYFAPASDLNTDGLATTASGDFSARVVRERVVDSNLVGDIVSHYFKFSRGLQCVVFASDVSTARELADRFEKQGVAAVALDGTTEDSVRDQAMTGFVRKEIRVLVNVDLFDEGLDIPGVEAVILGRPTMSLVKYLQMIGRCLRPVYAPSACLDTADARRLAISKGGKPFAIIIDPVRNWVRHGRPDLHRAWSLDSTAKIRGESGDSMTSCMSCTQPYERYYKACPYCGHVRAKEPSAGRAIEQVDGDLLELNAEETRELLDWMKAANVTEEQYVRGQIARGVPPVGRGKDLKRYRETLYRRKVLENLIAWWVGVQPSERTMPEKYRRFKLRFGVDMVTAFTLKLRDTDALISSIIREFEEDTQ